jgi:hypothetical protein
MTRSEIATIVIVVVVSVLPVLLGVSLWLWLAARKRAATALVELNRLRGQVTTLLADLGHLRGYAESVNNQWAEARGSAPSLETQLTQLRERFQGVSNLDHEMARQVTQISEVQTELARLRGAYAEKRALYDRLAAEVAIFDDRLAFAEMGVYEPHFDYSDSEQYKTAIAVIRERQKLMVSDKVAVSCSKNWQVDGSTAKGATMINRNIRLTLRAFNNESDAAISNTRWNNAIAMEKRIVQAHVQIEKMNATLDIHIHPTFLKLKLDELYLTHEYREKLRAEKEERAEAARLAREEQRLVRDLERAEDEEAHYARLLEKARAEAASIVGEQLEAFNDQIEMLERDLAEAHAKAERAKAMAERTRTGWVYVISNIGSFGEGVVKIGLTRRLDPLDRIRELGDASVPFTFDVHALIYSDDAPTLERALHGFFELTRINTRNYRKEFFGAHLDDVEMAVRQLAPEAPFFKDIEAQEYRETLSKRRQALEASALTPEAFPSEI